jgi:hypothetical protein
MAEKKERGYFVVHLTWWKKIFTRNNIISQTTLNLIEIGTRAERRPVTVPFST